MKNQPKNTIPPNGNKKPQMHKEYLFSCPQEQLFNELDTSEKGLSENEVRKRLYEYGYNEPQKNTHNLLKEFLLRFTNPLIVVLLVIASVSIYFHEVVNAALVFIIACISIVIAFVQEYRAEKATESLQEMIHTQTTVIRDGKEKDIPLREVVPGDIVDLFAGDMIPADMRIISAKDFFVNQASLTGESFPIEKTASVPENRPSNKSDFSNFVYMGSSVVSGTALGVVINTGSSTVFGDLYRKISNQVEITSFDKGIRKFTMLMIHAMLILVAFIFFVIFFRRGDYVEAFLFSLGVAVGLTPQMLPMIVALTLSKGALSLSKKKVIVKHQNSIQNFGAMDILCTDKTGTLTLNKIILEKHCNVLGEDDEDVLRYAYLNSFYQTGLKNVLDKAILDHEKLSLREYEKIDEIPFDFSRKVMSVVVKTDHLHKLITKGAPEEIFSRCSHFFLHGTVQPLSPDTLQNLEEQYTALSAQGFRVLAIAYKEYKEPFQKIYTKEDEHLLILKGYVAFYDPPKESTKKALEALQNLKISVKILTGDNELVTKKICSDVGLDVKQIVSGKMLEQMSDEEINAIVEETTVFTRLFPSQKEQVINALQNKGHVVGYLGDGINDAPALKAADVGISVNNAVDIAKESADLILLKKSLTVLQDGVIEGRKIFGNIVKYIKMSSSSNFGNMLSMTGASLFLPFLPMLPVQILLNNLLYDFSQIAIPTDDVDKEYVQEPKPWDVDYIKKFMLAFGPISSIFDFITFFLLLYGFHASDSLFHTGWFTESLCTQTLVIYVIRTAKVPFLESMPSKFLLISTLFVTLLAFLIPISFLGPYFGFVSPPWQLYPLILLILFSYLFLVQKAKNIFLKRYGIS